MFSDFDNYVDYMDNASMFRSLIMAKITIETNKGTIEYYRVPARLAKSIVRILDYTISGTEIVSYESDSEGC